jgi:hypothetical protein
MIVPSARMLPPGTHNRQRPRKLMTDNNPAKQYKAF